MNNSLSKVFLFVFIFLSCFHSFPAEVKITLQTTQTSTAPVVSQDLLFLVSDYGEIRAYDKATLAKRWELELGKKVIYQSAFINNILFVPAEKELVAISKDGKIIGNISFNSTISSPVIFFDSKLVIATRNGNVYLISLPNATFSTRNIIKSIKLDGEIDSSYVMAGNKLYMATVNGKIYSIDSLSSLLLYDLGYSVWRSNLGFINNSIYIPSERSIYAINTQGRLLLVKKVSEGNLNSIASDGERIYVGSDDGFLYCLDLNGEIIWKFKTNNSIKTTPILTNDSIIFASRDKNIYSINKNGSLNWNISLLDWPSQIVYENGMLYTVTYDGTLYGISSLSCRITSPESNSTVLPILRVTGDAYAENGVKSVEIRTPLGDWQTVTLSNTGKNVFWSGNIQITGYPEGQVVVQCRVIDSLGNEERTPYSSYTYNLVYSEDKLPKLVVSYPQQVNINQPLVLKFFTSEGTILTDLTVKIEGETYKVTDKSGQFVYTPTKEGDLVIYVEKAGYQQKQIIVKVTQPLIQPIHILIIFIIAVLIVIYSSFKKGIWR